MAPPASKVVRDDGSSYSAKTRGKIKIRNKASSTVNEVSGDFEPAPTPSFGSPRLPGTSVASRPDVNKSMNAFARGNDVRAKYPYSGDEEQNSGEGEELDGGEEDGMDEGDEDGGEGGEDMEEDEDKELEGYPVENDAEVLAEALGRLRTHIDRKYDQLAERMEAGEATTHQKIARLESEIAALRARIFELRSKEKTGLKRKGLSDIQDERIKRGLEDILEMDWD